MTSYLLMFVQCRIFLETLTLQIPKMMSFYGEMSLYAIPYPCDTFYANVGQLIMIGYHMVLG